MYLFLMLKSDNKLGLFINLMRWFILDIDQLTRILVLCGTPTEETLNKITSEEVC